MPFSVIHAILHLIKLNAFVNLACSAFIAAGVLATPGTLSKVLLVLYVIAVVGIIATLHAAYTTSRSITSAAGMLEGPDPDIEGSAEMLDKALAYFERATALHPITVSFTLLVNAVYGVQQILVGSPLGALIVVTNVFVAVFIFMGNNNKKNRDKAKKLIGEKSKALRQKLVDAQNGMTPEPNVA